MAASRIILAVFFLPFLCAAEEAQAANISTAKCSPGVCSSGTWSFYLSGKTQEQCKAKCEAGRKMVNAPSWLDLKGMGATTTQSSEGWGGRSSRAIDGNSEASWRGGSCTHTRSRNSWWQVDLGSSHSIEAVKVTNRGDCCGNRLNGFKVELDGVACASGVGISQGETKSVPCVGTGQVLKVSKGSESYLSICEFGVETATVDGQMVLNQEWSKEGKCAAYSHSGSDCIIYTKCDTIGSGADDTICQEKGFDWADAASAFTTCKYE